MWRVVVLVVTSLLLTAAVCAEERPQGLLWNRSGLAATLPLQVKTNPGADYLLKLRDVGSGKEVLAAYIRGGAFFRVLVPPGRFDLLFATGTDWQGEDTLFGPGTEHFTLGVPLEFDAKVSRKEGHLIDLRDRDAIAIRDFGECQRLALDPESLRRPLGRLGEIDLTPHAQPRRPQEPLRAGVVDPTTHVPPLRPQELPRLEYDMVTRACD